MFVMYWVDPKDPILKVSCQYLYYWLRYRGYRGRGGKYFDDEDVVVVVEGMVIMKDRVWCLWPPPLNPPPSHLPSHTPSPAFGWSDLEMVLSARAVRSQWPVGPLRSHHISCFGLLVCLSTFCTELKYVKMLFFKFLTKTLITFEPFDRF